MTLGKSSKRYSKPPKFLDRASGFYGLLDETAVDMPREGELTEQKKAEPGTGREEGQNEHFTSLGEEGEKQEPGMFDFNEGMIEDDGTTTLLRSKPSRWRKGGRSRKHPGIVPVDKTPSLGRDGGMSLEVDVMLTLTETDQPAQMANVQFSDRQEADSQLLISKKKSKRERGGRCAESEGKAAKRITVKSYKRAIDRAFRRGWETFIANLHTVTLVPISPSPSSSSLAKKKSATVDYK